VSHLYYHRGFLLSAKRDSKAAARFFRKVLKGQHTQAPRVITVDKNAAYPVTVDALKEDEAIEKETELRQSKYLNNIVEQDHRNIKRIVKPMMGFKTFNTARRTLSGIEAMNMIRKGQAKGAKQGDSVSQVKFIEAIFGIAA
jgi:IS6 family transposase